MTARGVLLALLLGALLGAGGGLYYAWNVSPVAYTDTAPSTLAQAQRDDYVLLIASSHAVDHDLARARVRLASAGITGGQPLAALADRALDEGWGAARMCALAGLAQALGAASRALALCPDLAEPTPIVVPTHTRTPPPSATPSPAPTATPTATRRPTLTPTARPSPTPSPTPRYAYRVLARQQVCVTGQTEPLIVVLVQDAAGDGIPGVEVHVTWDGGDDHFFTGLKPEEDPGYGDFLMTPGAAYTVELLAAGGGASSPALADLAAFTCTGDAPGVWRVIYERIGE